MDIERLKIAKKAAESIRKLGGSAEPAAEALSKLFGELLDVLLAECDSLTTAQACERLKLKPGAIRQHVRRGRLVARHEGRELRITRESVEAFAANRRPRKKSEK